MDRAVDILHPLASLKWRQCRRPPVNVGDAKVVWLKDKVYVGGGGTSGSYRDDARLYIYSPAIDTWTTLDTPVYRFALTTYHSQLVLVGGKEYVGEDINGERTNKLLTLSEDGQWQETLPPMPTPCSIVASAVSHGDHLLVIGFGYPNGKVYVYNGHHWASAQHPPQWLHSIRSTIFNGHWYLMEGELGTCVYSSSLDSLLASCQPSETSQPSSLWKRLTDVPCRYCYLAVFGSRLVAAGAGSLPTTTSLHAYSFFTQSWVHIGDAPDSSSYFDFPCAIALSSNELMVVRGWTAFKASLKMTHFNPESSFNVRAVSLLEPAAGIPVMRTLNNYTQHIKLFLGLTQFTFSDLNRLLDYWIRHVQWVPPTWKNLLLIIRQLSLDELAQRIETYLSKMTEELSPTRGKQGGEEVDEQIRLRDDTNFQMKQEMTTMQQRIEDQKYQIEELTKGQQATVKVEGDGEMVAKLHLQEETIFDLKQQLFTMLWRFDDLKQKHEDLKSQLLLMPIKTEEEEGPHFPMKTEFSKEKESIILQLEDRNKALTFEVQELRHQLSLPPVMEEVVKKRPVSLHLVKTELKEEAVTMTKTETTSAQPTTATWNLRGVEVCGEMTVVVYSSHDQQITWPGYGLKLHILKGCLPAGMEQCIINIKASLAGQYEFPENSHLVSAVFWLRCEDMHKFTRAITVEIQHCAKSENVSNPLHFVRAVCSQKQLPYTFKQLPGGNFTSHSSYGVIELNSFSGVGVTQEGSEDREYCSRLFYMPVTRKVPNQEIDFVVSWNTEAHLSAIEDKYIKKGALPGPHQLVEFEAEAISLDIPMEGITIKGWKITPLIYPVVTKKQVDNFREGKLTPCCQLKAEISERRKKIPTLKYPVTLKGAKQPRNVFVIDLPAEATQTFGDLATTGASPSILKLEDAEPVIRQSTDGLSMALVGASGDLVTAGPPPSKRKRLEGVDKTTPLSALAGSSSNQGGSGIFINKSAKPKLKDLQKELYSKVVNEWEDIGIQLEIEEGRLMQIKLDNACDSKACLREMLRVWLSRVVPLPSWSALADALDTLGHQDIATHLRTKYCQ